MIFLTVGTLFPFDRLVRAVDTAVGKGLIEEDVFAQIGQSRFKPKNIRYVELLQKAVFDHYVENASSLISHAGIGTIAMALSQDKPLLVMPRMKRYKEHVNDHQVATAKKFEHLGHILAAYEVGELPGKIEQLRTFVPRKREVQPQRVVERIAQFLNELSVIKK